ncbi:uncharacterized protein LOC129801806 isoform X2 [Phlebotomus papatasi]|nr:uncharacterized protein LOC129801806 isoform X2 [Phlebotomus papatasi]XP_055703128.1 uncharacterized protein LOC129801806 isoform X2 [Phlebotomus papatasi]
MANQKYCFRFTWLGPNFYNESNGFRNATCDHLLNGASGIPCQLPLTITDNGGIPNTTYMWEYYQSDPQHIACRMAPGDVCVKYTYSFNHQVENITYFCSKVRIDNEGAATSGCYKEYRNGREIEVCVCESVRNEKPCNHAINILPQTVGIFIIGFVIVLEYWTVFR